MSTRNRFEDLSGSCSSMPYRNRGWSLCNALGPAKSLSDPSHDSPLCRERRAMLFEALRARSLVEHEWIGAIWRSSQDAHAEEMPEGTHGVVGVPHRKRIHFSYDSKGEICRNCHEKLMITRHVTRLPAATLC